MKINNMKKHCLGLLCLAITSVTYAKDEKIQHDAHEHGVAEINIVWDKADLNIELLSPAFNITGFEFQPANHEQEEAIAKIEKKLNAPNELFSIIGASCKTVKTEIESPFEEHDDHEKHEGKEEHKKHEHEEHAKHDDHDEQKEHDEHKDDEKHAEHDDHKEHADHDKHEESTHSEYAINYEFTCANSKSELSIDTANVFKHFPNMEKIKVQWLSATQQSSAVLTKKSNTITLK